MLLSGRRVDCKEVAKLQRYRYGIRAEIKQADQQVKCVCQQTDRGYRIREITLLGPIAARCLPLRRASRRTRYTTR